jgi:predicted nucleic acid-binding protein
LSRFAAVFDACVLYPAPLRDFLVELATKHLFMAKWTDRIHEEWIGNLLKTRSDLDRARLERNRRLMNDAVPDCLVTGYEHLMSAIDLPDENDRHVVAAAVQAHANAIVTFNLKDFPKETLASLDLEAIHPDDFITFQFDLDAAAVLAAARDCRRRLANPAFDGEAYIRTLEAQSLPKTADRLFKYLSVL